MSRKRRAEQLIRLAYKLEGIANAMKAERGNSADVSDGVRLAARRIGDIGRFLRGE